jgi:uncharacterized membrane protein
MSHLLEIIIEVLPYLSWRIWVCFVIALIIACVLVGYDIAVFWRYDIAVLVVLMGTGTGAYWEVRSGELLRR